MDKWNIGIIAYSLIMLRKVILSVLQINTT